MTDSPRGPGSTFNPALAAPSHIGRPNRHTPATGPGIPVTRPSIAGVYNAATGGKDNSAPERAVLDAMNSAGNGIHLKVATREHLRFVARATAAVAAETGITQWLNLGCGLPSEDQESTFDIVSRYHKGARVVYVDNDPKVAVHGRALLDVAETTAVIEADARHVDMVLATAKALGGISRDQPAVIAATALVHFWADWDDPGGVLRRYMAAFPYGVLIFSHARDDLLKKGERAKMLSDYKPIADMYPRPRAVIESMFLDGLELLEPGLVEASTWRPDHELEEDVGRAHYLAAVARFGPNMT
ncbi:SAM-dependent methyltransferase [Nonomuraea sp. NPDC050202]|uniref:SAM-dependent methyltransferase n=1 Tax=Nonomuraea sp. NPDC050202 TaxID=3155035 RepID=UPI0033E8A15E